MEYIVVILVSVVRTAIHALMLLMFIRAILSWFPGDEESSFDRFLYVCTEPIITPVRSILDRFDFFSGLPIDLSFMATYLVLVLVLYLLPTVRF